MTGTIVVVIIVSIFSAIGYKIISVTIGAFVSAVVEKKTRNQEKVKREIRKSSVVILVFATALLLYIARDHVAAAFNSNESDIVFGVICLILFGVLILLAIYRTQTTNAYNKLRRREATSEV